jgi:hypothetical protein
MVNPGNVCYGLLAANLNSPSTSAAFSFMCLILTAVTNMGNNLLSLTSGQEATPIYIEHRDCSKAHRTLGMWPTPNGSTQTQFGACLAKSKQFAQGVIKAPMSRFEASAWHWTMCIPSINFGIGLTLLTPDQLNTIQKPMLNAILPKMGCSSKTCRHILFGPTKYLGIAGARDMVTERGVQQTLLLLKHIRTNTALSKLLRIGLEWFQLHAGISRPILECPDLTILCLEVGSWCCSLHNFPCLINAHFHIDMVRQPRPLREKDHALMETFLAMKHCTIAELSRRNLCRLCLQVEFLSEICLPDPSRKCVSPTVTVCCQKSGRASDPATLRAPYFGLDKRDRLKSRGHCGAKPSNLHA